MRASQTGVAIGLPDTGCVRRAVAAAVESDVAQFGFVEANIKGDTFVDGPVLSVDRAPKAHR